MDYIVNDYNADEEERRDLELLSRGCDSYDVEASVPACTKKLRNQTLVMRLTQAEMKEIEMAAATTGLAKSTYARMVVLRAAKTDSSKTLMI